MRAMLKWILQGALIVALVAGSWSGVEAGDDDESTEGWMDTAELGAVLTRGNSETTTFAFNNKLWRAWEHADLVINLGGIKADSTTVTRTAVGTPDNIIETEVDSTTAESYFVNGRYGHDITENFFWYTGLGWERNELVGIDNRYIAEAGVGNTWFDDEEVKFSTVYAVTMTRQENVFELPGYDDTFLGARFAWVYENQLTETTQYGNDFIVDLNLDETDDWRGDMVNWLSVAMSKRMALKVTLRLLYDNDPAFELLTIETPADPLVTTVPFALDEFDTILTASLVINF